MEASLSTEIKTVIEGEASESDEEPEEESKVVEKDETTTLDSKAAGVIVSGEASESEEENEATGSVLPPLNVNPAGQGDSHDLALSEPSSPIPAQHLEDKPKYTSLLNRKLRERNVALRRHIVDTIHQTYTIAGKDLHNITVQLQKTQIGFQDMNSHMQKSTNFLFALEDKVDIVQSCNILPNIKIPETVPASSN